MAERFTPAAIAAERPDLAPTGEAYCEMVVTGAIVAGTPPFQRLQVARYVRALLTRAPVAQGEAYEAHRAILGAFLLDLESATVMDALDGPEAPEPADIRDPGVVARERDLVRATRDWAATRRAETERAYEEHIDRILAGNDEAHGQAAAELDAAVASAQAALAAQPAAEEAANASVWD